MASEKYVFLIVDMKLNSILGAFSTQEKMEEGKKSLIKRDVTELRKKIVSELSINTELSKDRKRYYVGIINQIDYMLNDFNNRWEQVTINYDGLLLQSRYPWYRMKVDFEHFEELYGPMILLHPYEINKSEIIR